MAPKLLDGSRPAADSPPAPPSKETLVRIDSSLVLTLALGLAVPALASTPRLPFAEDLQRIGYGQWCDERFVSMLQLAVMGMESPDPAGFAEDLDWTRERLDETKRTRWIARAVRSPQFKARFPHLFDDTQPPCASESGQTNCLVPVDDKGAPPEGQPEGRPEDAPDFGLGSLKDSEDFAREIVKALIGEDEVRPRELNAWNGIYQSLKLRYPTAIYGIGTRRTFFLAIVVRSEQFKKAHREELRKAWREGCRSCRD